MKCNQASPAGGSSNAPRQAPTNPRRRILTLNRLTSGNCNMKTLALLAILVASIGRLIAVVTEPPLTISWVTETNSPLTLSPLGSASVPLIVDLRNGTIFVPAGGCQFDVSVVCSNEPVLAVEIAAQKGHTNEVEWSTDLTSWTPSNVRWISDGQLVRYYVSQPLAGAIYRVKEQNAAPFATILVFPLTGGLSSLSTPESALGPARIDGSPLTAPPNSAHWVVISPDGTDAEVVLQGSQSGDAENDPLQSAWEEGTNVFATAANPIKRLPLGQARLTLKVSDGIVGDAASVTVETIKPSAAVERLMALVSLDKDTNKLRPLMATLKAAAASFERNDIGSGVNQLEAFTRKLLQLQASGQQVLTQRVSFDETTGKLFQAAAEIIHALPVQVVGRP